MHVGAKPAIFKNALALRLRETNEEKLIWKHLKKRQLEGVRFRRQHPLHGYVVDFYTQQFKLCVEIDGDYHLDEIQLNNDANRDKVLRSHNLIILRFTNE